MVAAVTTAVSQMSALAVGAYPAAQTQVAQLAALGATKANMETRVSQATMLVAALGSVSDPHVRAWTFTLDGHDYYVLRLGNLETIIYDALADQWYDWGSDISALWRVFCGGNWQGGNNLASSYGSNVLVGDDGNGSLYFLDPLGSYDDDANFGSDSPRTFLREITGQVITMSFDSVPCFGVQLMGSAGETTDAVNTTVALLTSDDRGHTYDDHETQDVAIGDYTARVEWWSLGAFSAPGRLFKVQDYGALQRIDYLNMIEEPEKE
jgi:hypothetical protein